MSVTIPVVTKLFPQFAGWVRRRACTRSAKTSKERRATGGDNEHKPKGDRWIVPNVCLCGDFPHPERIPVKQSRKFIAFFCAIPLKFKLNPKARTLTAMEPLSFFDMFVIFCGISIVLTLLGHAFSCVMAVIFILFSEAKAAVVFPLLGLLALLGCCVLTFFVTKWIVF